MTVAECMYVVGQKRRDAVKAEGAALMFLCVAVGGGVGERSYGYVNVYSVLGVVLPASDAFWLGVWVHDCDLV